MCTKRAAERARPVARSQHTWTRGCACTCRREGDRRRLGLVSLLLAVVGVRDVAGVCESTQSGTPIEARALDRSFVRGVAWTAAAKWASQALAWVSWLIVARLLTPEDYGLVGMAAIYLGLVTLLSEFGLGTAVLAVRELSGAQIGQLNGLAVLLGLAGLLASCAVAIPLGRFFHAPQ